MTDVVFHYTEKFSIYNRGDLYCGPNPFDDLEDRKVSAVGRKILIDGIEREIKGTETFAIFRGPKFGESVGFLIKDLE